MGVAEFAACVLAVLALAVVAYVVVRIAWAVHGERVQVVVRRLRAAWRV